MADYDDDNDRYLGENQKGLMGKPKAESSSMWDWLTKRSKKSTAPAEAPNPNSNLQIDPQGAKSLKDAFK